MVEIQQTKMRGKESILSTPPGSHLVKTRAYINIDTTTQRILNSRYITRNIHLQFFPPFSSKMLKTRPKISNKRFCNIFPELSESSKRKDVKIPALGFP